MTFTVGGLVVETVPLDGAGQATTTVVSNATGGFAVAAVYGPSGLFAGSTAPAQTLNVSPPLAIALDAKTLNVAVGSSASANLLLTPLAGYQGAVAIACTSPQSFLTCSVDAPAMLSGPGSATVRLAVVKPAATAGFAGRGLAGLILTMLVLLPLRPRYGMRLAGILCALVLLGGATGCATGGNFFAVPTGPQVVTLQVSAVGVSVTTSLTVNVTN